MEFDWKTIEAQLILDCFECGSNPIPKYHHRRRRHREQAAVIVQRRLRKVIEPQRCILISARIRKHIMTRIKFICHGD